MLTQVKYTLPTGNRRSMRINLISTFLQEEPGNGIKELASRYQYYVESFQNYDIVLNRPTQLNKGFDFTVNIKGMFFKKTRRYTAPSHGDVINALQYAKAYYPHIYPTIAKNIQDIYNCQPFTATPSGVLFPDYDGNLHPIEIMLLAIKWLFMEQDCAYWNYSGRAMLYHELSTLKLV